MHEYNSSVSIGTCRVYPGYLAKETCSKFLANKHVYTDYHDTNGYFDLRNQEIEDMAHLFDNFVIRHHYDHTCSKVLLMLMCHVVFPRCQLKSDGEVIRQTICWESCNYLHTSVCKTFIPAVKNYFDNEKWRLEDEISQKLTMLFTCQRYPSKYAQDYPECLSLPDMEGKENETCHGSGYIYSGYTNKTKANETCNIWSQISNKHFFDLSSIESNYCRNPSGYRKSPWCYTKYNTDKWGYCDVTQCPVDGNYGEWSSFSNCSCKVNNTFRTRKCDNPVPKYHGKNCSHLGPNIKMVTCNHTNCIPFIKNTQGIMIEVLIPVFVVLTACLCSLALRIRIIRRRGKETIVPYEEKMLISENIDDLQRYEEHIIIEEIYEHMRKFSLCICSTCISNWLLDLVNRSKYKQNAKLIGEIEQMLQRLENQIGYDNLKRACCRDTVIEKDGDSDRSLSEVIHSWVKNELTYEKLNPCTRITCTIKECERRNRVLFGSFEICGTGIVPVYDKLHNTNCCTVPEKVMSSTPSNQECDYKELSV